MYGHHRDCYQYVTHHLDRLSHGKEQLSETEVSDILVNLQHIAVSSFSKRTAFSATIINNRMKKGGVWTSEGLCTFEFGGGNANLKMSTMKEDFDLLTRIGRYDLFAYETQYHNICRKQYTVNPET